MTLQDLISQSREARYDGREDNKYYPGRNDPLSVRKNLDGYKSPSSEEARAYLDDRYSDIDALMDPYGQEAVAYDTVSFLLKLDIPDPYRAEMAKFMLLINKYAAVGFIEREDMLTYHYLFRLVASLYRSHAYNDARIFCAEFLFMLNLSRSINGAFMYYMITKREEYTHRYPEFMRQAGGWLEKRRQKKDAAALAKYGPANVTAGPATPSYQMRGR